MDCLEFLPDSLVVEVSRGLAACSEDQPKCKRLFYGLLDKHYGQSQHPPLLSNHIFDIHSGISELLGKKGGSQSVHSFPCRRFGCKISVFIICLLTWTRAIALVFKLVIIDLHVCFFFHIIVMFL